MGQIIGRTAKPKRCNLNKLSQLGTPAAGEYILVSSDNSMDAAGQGDFDCYIVGDGRKTATELELKSLVDDGAFDISAYRAAGNVLAKYVDLSAALDGGNNIPEAMRKGGISVKFVQSSDNKYVQYMYLGTSTTVADFTDVNKWEKFVLEDEFLKGTSEGTLLRTDADDVQNKYINANGNIAVAGSVKSYFYDNTSDYIIHVKATLASTANNQKFIGFYSSLEPSSSTLIGSVNTVISNSYLVDVDVPTGCKLVVIANNHTIISDPNIEVTWKSELIERLEDVESSTTDIESDINAINEVIEDIEDIETVIGTAGYFLTSDGTLSQSANYNCTFETVDGQDVVQYIEVKTGDVILYNGTASGLAKAIVGFDASKQVPTVLLGNSTYGTEHQITVTNNIKFVAICYNNLNQHNINIDRGYIFADKEEFESVKDYTDYLHTVVLDEDDAYLQNKKIVDANGDLQNASVFYAYWFNNTEGRISHVKATLGSNTVNKYGIAFYSSLEPSSETFMSGLASQGISGYQVEGDVPDGCKLVIVINMFVGTESYPNPLINLTRQGEIPTMKRDIEDLEDQVGSINSKIPQTTSFDSGYIYNNGTIVVIPKSTSMRRYTVNMIEGGFTIKMKPDWYLRSVNKFDKYGNFLSRTEYGSDYAGAEVSIEDTDNSHYFQFDANYTSTSSYPTTVDSPIVSISYDKTRVDVGANLADLHPQFFGELDLSFDLAGEETTYPAQPRIAPLSSLYALWDDIVSNYGGVKANAATEAGITPPAYMNNAQPLYIYKFLSNQSRNDKSKHIKVLVYAGEHVNEYLSHNILLRFMQRVCGNWATDHNCELLRSMVDWYVLPCINPYGYDFRNTRTNYNSVNINRNFAASNWTSRSDEIEQGNYGGPSAASEFETQIVQYYVENIEPDIMMDIHTGNTNMYGSIGSLEMSVNDLYYNKMDFYKLASTICRTGSNLFTMANTNYPQNLVTPLLDTNVQLESAILEAGTTNPYTGLSHQYAMEKGVKLALLVELNQTSNWENGVFDAETVVDKADTSAALARGNLLYFINLMYRAVKAISQNMM